MLFLFLPIFVAPLVQFTRSFEECDFHSWIISPLCCFELDIPDSKYRPEEGDAIP